jgi:hypothetical protein
LQLQAKGSPFTVTENRCALLSRGEPHLQLPQRIKAPLCLALPATQLHHLLLALGSHCLRLFSSGGSCSRQLCCFL